MKNIFIMLLVVLTTLSCADEIKFSTPAIEGIKDGEVLFRSVYFASDIDNGGFLIEGGDNFEVIQLITTIDAPGIYDLGDENFSRAIFKDANGRIYSTANVPDPSVSLYPADGQIIVEDVVNTEPKSIIGTFWFNAFTIDGTQSVNFSEGNFYKVPLFGGLEELPNGISCELAIYNANVAQANFELNTDTTSIEYYFSCTYYKSQLIQQINSCGDPDGSIQAIIDSLGDCGGFD